MTYCKYLYPVHNHSVMFTTHGMTIFYSTMSWFWCTKIYMCVVGYVYKTINAFVDVRGIVVSGIIY